MPLLRRRSDLPLANDPSSRFLAWITALMCYLAGLALMGTFAVSSVATAWDTALTGGLTVQVAPLPADTGAAPLSVREDTVLSLLRAFPGVRAAEPLPKAELSRLLEPWLGPGAAEDPNLPVPSMIDVTAGPGLDAAALKRALEPVPGVTLDDHGTWLADLRTFARAVEAAAALIVAVVGGAGLAAVSFAVRSGLAIHNNVVRLLHLMGATDRYVARQFERHVLALSLRGGILGLLLAGLTATALGFAARNLGSDLLSAVDPDPVRWAIVLCALFAVPLTAAALAVGVARWTVLRSLEAMP
jgi:cell division transport system permease protein